jgi:hypothetical protein
VTVADAIGEPAAATPLTRLVPAVLLELLELEAVLVLELLSQAASASKDRHRGRIACTRTLTRCLATTGTPC